jgi:transposase
MQDRLDRAPKSMRVRRATVEHPFGTLKAWMGATRRLISRRTQPQAEKRS